MEPSPAPHERPAKAEASDPVKPGSLSRFERLAQHLFGVDRDEFKKALKEDDAARRAKRGS